MQFESHIQLKEDSSSLASSYMSDVHNDSNKRYNLN